MKSRWCFIHAASVDRAFSMRLRIRRPRRLRGFQPRRAAAAPGSRGRRRRGGRGGSARPRAPRASVVTDRLLTSPAIIRSDPRLYRGHSARRRRHILGTLLALGLASQATLASKISSPVNDRCRSRGRLAASSIARRACPHARHGARSLQVGTRRRGTPSCSGRPAWVP